MRAAPGCGRRSGQKPGRTPPTTRRRLRCAQRPPSYLRLSSQTMDDHAAAVSVPAARRAITAHSSLIVYITIPGWSTDPPDRGALYCHRHQNPTAGLFWLPVPPVAEPVDDPSDRPASNTERGGNKDARDLARGKAFPRWWRIVRGIPLDIVAHSGRPPGHRLREHRRAGQRFRPTVCPRSVSGPLASLIFGLPSHADEELFRRVALPVRMESWTCAAPVRPMSKAVPPTTSDGRREDIATSVCRRRVVSDTAVMRPTERVAAGGTPRSSRAGSKRALRQSDEANQSFELGSRRPHHPVGQRPHQHRARNVPADDRPNERLHHPQPDAHGHRDVVRPARAQAFSYPAAACRPGTSRYLATVAPSRAVCPGNPHATARSQTTRRVARSASSQASTATGHAHGTCWTDGRVDRSTGHSASIAPGGRVT